MPHYIIIGEGIGLTLVFLFLVGCGNHDVECAFTDCPKPHNPSTNTITADQMSQLTTLSAQIRTWAPTCQGGIACLDGDDGDSMLWAGLLCSTGERAQCDAVQASQTADGRLWRAPSHVNVDRQNSGCVPPFTRGVIGHESDLVLGRELRPLV
jgi:hypothetical protein